MRRFVYQLVDRLGDPGAPLSRNRHFALFSTPAGAHALRVHRYLRSLERDLARHADALLVAEARGPEVELRLEIPSLRLVRTARLTPDDLRSICRHEGPLPDALAPFLQRAATP